jgi:hypothetical protein
LPSAEESPFHLVSQSCYENGLKKAVESCDASLRHLWAAVSNTQLQRRSADIFDDYAHNERSLRKDPDYMPDRQAFNNKMNRLKTETHGSVLLGTRQGWYEFRLPILRGYCRLMAREAGLNLGVAKRIA